MHKLTALIATCLIALPGVARAAEPPCLTGTEFASLAGYSLPSVISGTTQRCDASLGADAYLKRNGTQLAARYAERKAANWPGAKAAFMKLSATKNEDANKLLSTMPDPSLQQMIDAVMEGMVSQQIPTERCGVIDNVVRLLAPLPPANTAELIALAVGLGAKSGKGKVGSITLCPVQ